MTISLDMDLSTWVFGFLIAFARIGSALMLLPGIGDLRVPVRVRLLFGLAVTAIMLPGLIVPNAYQPAEVSSIIWLVVKEVGIGLFIGSVTAMMMSVLHVCGSIVAAQIGLSNALTGELFSAEQGAAIGSLLMAAGLVVVFSTGLDHLMLQGIARSYIRLPLEDPLPLADFSQFVTETLSSVFATALQLSAPFVILGLAFNVGLGLANRAFPQLPAFFLALPASLAGGLFLLMVTTLPILFDFAASFESFSEGLLP